MPKGYRGRAICKVDECTRYVKGYGYCLSHLRALRLYDDPEGSYTSIREGKTCSVEDCERPVNAVGLCTLHYNRQQVEKRAASGVCSIDGCNKPLYTTTWCEHHYNQYRRYDDPECEPGKDFAERRAAGCSVDGCDRLYKASGFCDMHWVEARKQQDDPNYRRNPKDWRERLELFTDRAWVYPRWRPHLGRCWTLTNGMKTKTGYITTGATREGFNKTNWLVHRLAYELWVGPIPAGKVLDHVCANRACCNPFGHLEVVTQQQNSMRGRACQRCEWLEQCPNCVGQLSAYGVIPPLPPKAKIDRWVTRRMKTMEERFWFFAGAHDGPISELMGGTRCWDWEGSTNEGYGVVQMNKRTHLAHRLAFEYMMGVTVPDDLVVDHRCLRPSCLNARDGHIEIVTLGENTRRAFTCARCQILKSCPFCALPLHLIQSASTWRADTERVNHDQLFAS